MTYLLADTFPTAPAGLRFRALVERPGILQLPGAYNGLSALQAKAAGFDRACTFRARRCRRRWGCPTSAS